MKNVNVSSYDYVQITKATALFVTGYECFSPCPDMYILRPVACHILVSLQRQRHGFAICYKRDKLNLPYFCTYHNMWLVSMSTFFVCGGLVCNHIKPTLGFIAAFNTLLVNWSETSQQKHLIKVWFACLMNVFSKFCNKRLFKRDQSVLCQQQSFRAPHKILKLLLDWLQTL